MVKGKVFSCGKVGKNRELKCFVYRVFEKYTLFMVSL